MKVARVLTIRDGGQYAGGGYPQPVVEQAMDAVAMAPPPVVAPPPSIRPGTTLTRVAVQVDFALEPK
jgi:hypothetical protein